VWTRALVERGEGRCQLKTSARKLVIAIQERASAIGL
jgi:hypothetical protein